MKKIIALLIALMLLLTACAEPDADPSITNPEDPSLSTGITGSPSTDHEPDKAPDDNGHTDNDQTDNNQTDNNQTDNDQTDNNQTDNNQTDNDQTDNDQTDNDQTDNDNSSNDNNTDNNAGQPTHTHNYVATVTAPTCVAAGYTTYTCSSCNDSYTANEVKALGHTEKTVSGYAATCTKDGLSDGVECSVCFITITKQQTIPATGHSWQAATTEAPKTCSTCGTTEGEKLPSTTTPDSESSSSGYSDTLYVNYINVGQGDSILIKVGDCDILIDGGKSGQGSTVTSYLQSMGVDDIELMINSHPDEDHYGGLTTVLKNYDVEAFWGSSYSKSTSTYTTFKSAISSEGLSFKTPSVGTVYTYEYLTLTVLYNGSGASNSNDSSLVVMLEYGSFRFLFTGDISSTIENKLASSGKDLSCDVLKVAHHGSEGSSSSTFLGATGADYAVISVGSNSYGHPTASALSNLSSAGMSVYRTDTNGSVVFSTNGASLTLPGGSTVGGGSGSSSGGTSSGGTSSGSGSSSSGSSSSNTDWFIGNTESKVFHLPTCGHLPAASKQNQMYNYWWIINIAGYRPCGICLKNYIP